MHHCLTFAVLTERNPAGAGGENGFNQAIELSAEMLSNVKFVQEKRLIGRFFEEISQDSGEPGVEWGAADGRSPGRVVQGLGLGPRAAPNEGVCEARANTLCGPLAQRDRPGPRRRSRDGETG